MDYERVKDFSNYILCTTATVQSKSAFYGWNNMEKTEKLKQLKNIGAISKKRKKRLEPNITEFLVLLIMKVIFWKN